MKKLSVALAVFNEGKTIEACLESVKDIADEIIVVDGSSTDNTVEIAKKYNAKIIITDNPPMFHLNKMKAINASTGDWILQLDADERVSEKLGSEIKKLTSMNDDEIKEHQEKIPNKKLFLKHQDLLGERDGRVGKRDGEYVAFFIPRANYFLGRYLMHGGVYPDGVIRLFKKDKAYLPCKDVHEQYVVDGKVGWLSNDLLHYDSPTFSKYIMRNNRYTLLMATDMKKDRSGYSLTRALSYLFIKPIWWFFLTFFRHKGFLDSWQGLIFSFFSSLRFPISYIKFLEII
jgi:hypothetical protein